MNEKRIVKTTDEVASMFLGLVIVGALVMIIFNVFNRVRGRVDIPGITDQTQLNLNSDSIKKNEDVKQVETKTEKNTYKVKAGDSLWKIAQSKLGDGNKWVEIAKNNNLKNPSILAVGQELKVSQVVVTKSSEYTVAKGDSLWKIAVVQYADGYQWTRIWQDNRVIIKNPNMLEVGMVLKLSH